MTLDDLIDRLARQYGLGDAYHDYRGELKIISRSTKQAILAAMGCSVDDAAGIEAALARQESQRWETLLPPVAVVTPAGRFVTLAVAADAWDCGLDWQIDLEQGGRRSGSARVGDLAEFERADVQGRTQTRRRLDLPDDLPNGYHALRVAIRGATTGHCALIAAPQACFEPQLLREGRRLWGVAVQLYTLRSSTNWGIGDFADLEAVVRVCAPAGASFIGLNPLHALFPSEPRQFSPYSASSRHFLNVLYIAVERVPEYPECDEVLELVSSVSFQAELSRLRGTDNVDYPGVARAKFAVLGKLYDYFVRAHVATHSDRAQQFAAYKAERGAGLRLHALYDAIDEYMRAQGDQYWGWPTWPEGLRRPDGSGVQPFAADHAARVDYFAWLQWLADEQLTAVQRVARDSGMPIGLYGDYAVGVNPSGAETWSDQALYRKGAGVGAPPDALALKGQDWGIPPQDPNVLKVQHFNPFRKLLAASMRSFGALRLDHVMALYRQWWVPVGLESIDGGYVHYPVDELMSVLALESERLHCLVIGEDLGTVAPEMSHLMRERTVYSYRVLLFEKHGDGRFREPAEYPRRAIATVTTHDLPTLRGYWCASDIALRGRLALYPDDDVRQRVINERVHDRSALLRALASQGLQPVECPGPEAPYSDALAHAVQVYLARSASALVALQAEDLLGMGDPVNVPGTRDEYPNWQRKMTSSVADLFGREEVHRLFADVDAARRV